MPVAVIVFVIHPFRPEGDLFADAAQGQFADGAVQQHFVPVFAQHFIGVEFGGAHGAAPGHGAGGEHAGGMGEVEHRHAAGDHADHGLEVRVSAGGYLPLHDGEVGCADHTGAAVAPRLGGQPVQGVVAVILFVDDRLPDTFGKLAAAGILRYYGIAVMCEAEELAHAELVVAGADQYGGEFLPFGTGGGQVDIGGQLDAVAHLYHFRADEFDAVGGLGEQLFAHGGLRRQRLEAFFYHQADVVAFVIDGGDDAAIAQHHVQRILAQRLDPHFAFQLAAAYFGHQLIAFRQGALLQQRYRIGEALVQIGLEGLQRQSEGGIGGEFHRFQVTRGAQHGIGADLEAGDQDTGAIIIVLFHSYLLIHQTL